MLRVGYRGVKAATAEWTEQVGRVSGQKDASNIESVCFEVIEVVYCGPFDVIWLVWAYERTDAPLQATVETFIVDLKAEWNLPIEAPDIVGLWHHKSLQTGIRGRAVVESALPGDVKFSLDINNQKAVGRAQPCQSYIKYFEHRAPT